MTFEKVKEIIVEQLGLEESEVKENTSFEYKNGGKVTTHKSRIEHASKSKRETLKFEKELGMAKIFAQNGYNVELLEELSGISSDTTAFAPILQFEPIVTP